MLNKRSVLLKSIGYALMAAWAFQLAYASTDYIPVERAKDIRIFEDYLDIIEKKQESIASIKLVTLQDKNWRDAASKYANTISSVYSASDGSVILENQKFNFKIIFMAEYMPTQIRWTCKIEDSSLIFRPRNCGSWSKVIVLKNKKGDR